MSSKEVKVYIPCGGGLGDVIQSYLASPDNHWIQSHEVPDKFPTSDNYLSLWFRRLESFKFQNQDSSIIVKAMCHNPAITQLFQYHPFIDYTELIRYEDIGEWWRGECDGYKNIRYYKSNDDDNRDYEEYIPSEPVIYLSDSEYKYFNSIICKPFVVIHPFAGLKHRAVLDEKDYINIIDRLIDEGLFPIVIGGTYKRNTLNPEFTNEEFYYETDGMLNLVNRSSVQFNVRLAMECKGFIGTHSSMILPAWYNKVHSVCIVPPTHDGGQAWEEFASSGNPTAWGFKQDFNKTIIVRDKNNIDYEEIIEWVTHQKRTKLEK